MKVELDDEVLRLITVHELAMSIVTLEILKARGQRDRGDNKMRRRLKKVLRYYANEQEYEDALTKARERGND